MHRRRFIGGLSAVVAAMAGGAFLAGDLAGGSDGTERSERGVPDGDPSGDAPGTATVRRGDLATEQTFAATVGFGEPWVLATTLAGIVTAHPPVGATVGFGEELVRVDDRPLVLAEGAMPMFRELRQVDASEPGPDGGTSLLAGDDVAQLQRMLQGEGYDGGGYLETDGVFDWATRIAVEAWQQARGLPVTGRVDSAQLLFAPSPLRIDTDAVAGTTFTQLRVTTADAIVSVDTSASDRRALVEGATASVTLPDGTVHDGTISSQRPTTTPDGSSVWRTTVAVDAELPGDTTEAEVSTESIVATDALIVPVTALLALAEGGFAVERLGDAGATALVPVTVGAVLDGLAEVDGVAEGDIVVVPA